MQQSGYGIRRAGFAAEAREREERLQQRRKERNAADAAEAPVNTPKRSERPSKRAQWDELRAAWVEWDPDAGDWKVVGDQTS